MDEIYLRRSVRNYLTTPVEKEKLLAVVKAGTCAPSALNNMYRQFTVISNKDIIKELNSAVAAAIDSETLQRINERTNGNFNFFYSAPVLIVVSTERQSFCPGFRLRGRAGKYVFEGGRTGACDLLDKSVKRA